MCAGESSPVRPSEHRSNRCPGTAGTTITSGSQIWPVPRARVMTLRRGCTSAWAGVSWPIETRYCTSEWSTVSWVTPTGPVSVVGGSPTGGPTSW